MFADHDITTERRQSSRRSVQIEARLHTADSCQPVTITDLATDGAGVHVAIGLAPGDVVALEFMNGRRLAGEIVWRLMGSCGIVFSESLSADDPLLSSSCVCNSTATP